MRKLLIMAGAALLALAACEVDETPPDNVSTFTATGQNGAVSLSWSNPGDADYAGVMIRYDTVEFPASTTAGELAGNVAASSTALVVGGLTNGTTYYFTAFSYDAEPNYSSGVDASAAPDGTAPGNVTGLTAASGDGQIVLSWTNPTDSDYNGAMIRRATDGAPSATSSGTLVTNTDSDDTTYTDTGLTNGTEYAYSLFSKDAGLNYSTGSSVATTPGLTILEGGIDLTGTWTSDCINENSGDDDTPSSEQVVLTITNNTAVQTFNHYTTDDTCTTRTYYNIESFTFTLQGTKTLSSEETVNKVDIEFTAHTFVVLTQTVADELNANSSYGISDWEVDVERDVFGTDSDGNDDTDHESKQIFYVETSTGSDVLKVGNPEEEGGAVDTDGYPEAFLTFVTFSRE